MAGHRHLPGDGVAQRYVLNRFVLAEDNLGCCPEGPDDAIDLRFLIIDELDAWVIFLSWTLRLESEGRWPWQPEVETTMVKPE